MNKDLIETDFEMVTDKQGSITILATCIDIVDGETIGLNINFYDDTMTPINYNYDKRWLCEVEQMAIPLLTAAKKVITDEEEARDAELYSNWHGHYKNEV